jgi:hypothetical protein
MLVGIIALYFIYNTFDYTTILQQWRRTRLHGRTAYWLFLAFAFAFCIKVPVFPLHTWLPTRTPKRRPRLRHSRRRVAEDGNLRAHAFQPRAVSDAAAIGRRC